ncbi:helix-turn-helix domain-containing protein [Ruminococcus gauvreauii]|uniref:Helix-turn-helix transcriptional regulator n=1 Tax=Ruminococcus gauvreauii TaxID=438033 RepID=A0ABY5VLG6_9FIRM|nr:helix-turn-helix transcriptional regulator [Ruminococcus gauvreauii]UWP60846.1 helix-turn-helix transcriptional regulator [Ruminococcus gauvreauii]
MAISYNGLWKILIHNGMKKGDLKRRTGISSGTIAKMTNGEAVTLTVLEKICNELNCDIGDLVEIDAFNDKKVGEEKNGKR